MIRNIKIFVNDDPKAIELAKIVKNKFIKNDFIISDESYDLGIAIGGDGSFLRMVKDNQFDSDLYYVGINAGHLGFMQEVKIGEEDKLIEEIMTQQYKIEQIGIQETNIYHKKRVDHLYTLNEIILQNDDLRTLNADVLIDNNLLEHYSGDGLMIVTSVGSTAHNLSYGGCIVDPSFHTLQITPMAPINSSRFCNLRNSVILPSKTKITIIPNKRKLIIRADGEIHNYKRIHEVTTSIEDKKIKCLRFSKYNFVQKINEKLLTGEK